MNNQNRFNRLIATFFLVIFFPTLIPSNLYAANNGPNSPEAASFEPVDATDMVSLATGDMAYSLPLLNVPSPEGGYPVSLAYHAGIGNEQEASWIGLGWNLNPGSINRSVNGAPDDWKGAQITDYEHFASSGQSVGLSVSYSGTKCAIDASIGYAWDSNGTKKGSVAIGVGKKGGGYGASIGASYSNDGGWSGSISAGMSNSSGFGIGVSADTDGFIGVGAGHSVAGKKGNLRARTSTVGISLSSNKGNVGVGLSGGGNSIYNSQSGNSSTNSFGLSAGFYLYGFVIGVDYQNTRYERNKSDIDYVYGPLYYSNLSNNPANGAGIDISYPGGMANVHNRDVYMDAYSQPIPQYEGKLVSYTNVFGAQKNSYNAPAYDSYQVNAQGLSGVMSPRLLDNGLIINPGVDIQYEEEQRGMKCVHSVCESVSGVPTRACDCPPYVCGFSVESQGYHVTDKRIYVNSHFSNDPNHKFKNTFGQPNSTLNFYFDYQFPSDLKVTPSTLSTFNNASSLENYLNSANTTITSRKENSDYIETFTNQQITSGQTNGSFLEAKGYNRSQDAGYRPDGIGGYRITTADGKTYHYSRPVYQFEQIYREMHPKYNDDNQVIGVYTEADGFFRQVTKTEPYATHWLLTAITGPDYVKMSSDSCPGERDYGYWVRFDYGKWTDGYIWRTPSDKEGYNRLGDAPLSGNTYSKGRKQLVYLDKIVTRTHTALFIKSLREDDLGNGRSKGFDLFDANNGQSTHLGQKTLKLDEIILAKNEEVNGIEASTQHRNLTSETGGAEYSLNQQAQVVDKGDLALDPVTLNYSIYQKALKIIRLNQTYDLAKQSPNSTAYGTKGRLTLRGVHVAGRNNESFIPPYTFEYIGENINYSKLIADKDDWGYRKDNPMLWSLNKINNPTGSSIQFDYEQDQYYTEAFSRRMFDEEDLKFRAFFINGQPVIEFQRNSYWQDPINFLEYFDIKDPSYASLYCCHSDPDDLINQGDKDWLVVPGQAISIRSVSANSIIFNVPPASMWEDYDQVAPGFVEKGGWKCSIGNQCITGEGDTHSSWVFNFKVMANKVPKGDGGGIRVSKISLVNDMGEKTTTEYNYNDPIKNRISGITSYAPQKGNKYVAYRSEVPGPRVMYEYVTMNVKNALNESIGTTQYRFNVLKPALNVFDPNMTSGEHFRATTSVNTLDPSKKTIGVDVKLEDNFATLGSVVSVSDFNNKGQLLNQVNNNFLTLNELSSNTVEKPGVLQESFHSMKSIYDYTKDWMSGGANAGFINWSETCEGQQTIGTNKRIVTSSSKIVYPLVQNKKEEISGNFRKTTEYKKIDPKSGLYLESYTTLANGTQVKTEQVPAYTKYPEMGSKAVNSSNKHMLTQETMALTYVKVNNQWKTTSANITTWNKNWSYRDNFGNETLSPDAQKVWRKHKAFVWKENVGTDGSFSSTITPTNAFFDWSTGNPITPFWHKSAEITRYNHYSSPMETKDINGNFASSKMADRNSKVIVSGNARYTEMYYSGAEYIESGNNFEGEVLGANFRTNDVAHTGKYSVKATTIEDKVFEVKGSSGTNNYYANPNTPYSETFRPGKYKVSFWVLKQDDFTKATSGTYNSYGANLFVNNVAVNPTEVVDAGCWKQLNYTVDIPASVVNNSVVVKSASYISPAYFDDFRMYPVASSINSYVYDDTTDELSYKLDANNMGSAYKYDDAGRLIGSYVEDVDNGASLGGFKLIGQSKQNYQNTNTTTVNLPSKIDNCLHINNELSVNITNICSGTFAKKFNVAVSGGSGNYSYQYKWLKDVSNNTYTNYVNGSNQPFIPYVPNFCYTGPQSTGGYGKKWNFVVKVKDLNTNFEVEQTYDYEEGCALKKNQYLDSDLEISNCYPVCPDGMQSFRVHLKDIGDDNGSLKYEYSYYDPLLPVAGQTLNWVDVTSANGVFCPVYSSFSDPSCPSGTRKRFEVIIRITNLLTGQIADSYYDTGGYIGACTSE